MLKSFTRRPLLAVALLTALSVTVIGGCREETEAMKKANLGRALMERGALEKSIQTLEESIRLDPELAMSYEALGGAYEAAGNYQSAADAYRNTIIKDPVRDSAYSSLGCLLLHMGDNEAEAEQVLNKAIEINQTHAGAHACLGAAFLERRDYAASIKSSELAVSLNPQSVQAHLNLGIAFSEIGEIERAKQEVEKAIRFAAGNPQVVNRAKMLLESLNHPEMAERQGHG
jgi:tetratricopeptide (TPR) repeat protein